MDPPTDERTAGPYRSNIQSTTDGRPSIEAPSPRIPPRLQKKRSSAGVRVISQLHSTATGDDTPAEDTGERGVQRAKKGSLRNAVRKLFGRRSREPEPQSFQTSPPSHGYHKSEPYTILATQPEVPEDTGRENAFGHRTFSAPIAPIQVYPSPAVQRTRSPYAVEFPQSARLKPLNLGNPYTAPGSQLRRRKTMPSILIPDADAAIVEAALTSPVAPPVPDDDEGEIGRAVSTDLKREKRRSRSAGDLKSAQSRNDLTRKRSDEIRYWRESYQPTVLRASGFTIPVEDDNGQLNVRDEDRTPIPTATDTFNTDTSPLLPRTSPGQRGLGVHESDFASPSAMGSNISQDIEDRVARLEAGLRSFRGELAQMAADRNRRTVLIGNIPSPSLRHRESSPGRTASLLAETLQEDLAPSDYPYDYTDTLRPSTSPQPPRTPDVRYVGPSPGQTAGANPDARRGDDPFTTTPSPPRPSTSGGRPAPPPESIRNPEPLLAQPAPDQQYTFRSLYEMLADERSARRRLEMQMRGLREDIANLHYQVSNVSNVQSQRSSYYAAMDPMVGSSRLHALIRDTEESPPRTAHTGRLRDSRGITIDPRVISRFSGSESEAGMAESTDLETPYEAYQTPTEEGPFPFHARTAAAVGGAEGQMF